MKLIYVAGRFRGKTSWEVHRNVTRAEEAAYEVARVGAMPVIPHAMTAHFDGTFTDEFWLDGVRELMTRCDAVYIIDHIDLETSQGTKMEVAAADVIDIPVFIGSEGLKDLRSWLTDLTS